MATIFHRTFNNITYVRRLVFIIFFIKYSDYITT